MPEIVLFCEDSFHERFVSALLKRFEAEYGVSVSPQFRSATGGLPQMHSEFRVFLRDLSRDRRHHPDAVIAVLDSNCIGYTERRQQLHRVIQDRHPRLEPLVSYGIPEPHIERWMLSDPDAFRSVFGRGCTVPKTRRAKGEYKRLLRDEIRASGRGTLIGGAEYAEDIVSAMDLNRAAQNDQSLARFLRDIRARMNRWKADR